MDVTTSQTEQLRKFISEITFKEIDQITEDTLLFDEGIFDSLGFLSLISFISEEFGIEVDNDELNEENFATIRSIVSFISHKKNHQEA
jgi:acyl carrier protein